MSSYCGLSVDREAAGIGCDKNEAGGVCCLARNTTVSSILTYGNKHMPKGSPPPSQKKREKKEKRYHHHHHQKTSTTTSPPPPPPMQQQNKTTSPPPPSPKKKKNRSNCLAVDCSMPSGLYIKNKRTTTELEFFVTYPVLTLGYAVCKKQLQVS